MDVDPAPSVVKPPPQLSQDPLLRKKLTSQMHWSAEIEPVAAVVNPTPQLVQVEIDVAPVAVE